jgi:hypothetical protein
MRRGFEAFLEKLEVFRRRQKSFNATWSEYNGVSPAYHLRHEIDDLKEKGEEVQRAFDEAVRESIGGER